MTYFSEDDEKISLISLFIGVVFLIAALFFTDNFFLKLGLAIVALTFTLPIIRIFLEQEN